MKKKISANVDASVFPPGPMVLRLRFAHVSCYHTEGGGRGCTKKWGHECVTPHTLIMDLRVGAKRVEWFGKGA